MNEILLRSQRLQKDMTLENLFGIICDQGDKVAARYLEGDAERTITYSQYKRRAFSCAAFLRRALGPEKKGAFIALQMDTCPDYFSLFWGVLAAGYNAVLLDYTLNEEMTAYMLGQAGAVAVIAKGAEVGGSPSDSDVDNWGVAVVAEGVRIGSGAKLAAKEMADEDLPDVK